MALTIIDPTNSANVDREGEYKRIGDTKPGWSQSGDATPHSIASTQGGTGSLTFNASQALGESDLLVARDVMVDGAIGKFQSTTIAGENVNLTVDTILSRLNARRVAQSWATNFEAGLIPWPKGQEITVAGSPRTIAGVSFTLQGGDSHGGYLYFYGRSTDSTGNFPVVIRYTETGVYDTAWSPSGGTAEDLSGSQNFGFAIDKVNNFIYLTNYIQTGGAVVKKYTMTGTYVSEFRPGTTGGVAASQASLAVDSAGNVYVGGGATGSVIQKFSSTGTLLANAGTTSTTGDYGFGSSGVNLDFDGANLIVANRSGLKVRAYNTSLVFQANVSIPNVMGGYTASVTVDRTNEIVYAVFKDFSGESRLYSYGNYAYSYAPRKANKVAYADRGMVTDGKGRIFIPKTTFSDLGGYFSTDPKLQLLFDRDGPAKLSVMIHYYMCLALSASAFDYRFNATDPTVVFGGWDDNVWEMLKQLAAAKAVTYRTNAGTAPGGVYRAGIEVVPLADTTVTDLDQTVAGSLQLTVAMQNATRTYEIVNQNSSTAPFGNSTVVYSSFVDGQGFSIDVDKTAFTQVSVDHSLVTVATSPPEVSTWADSDPGYQVYDANGLKLPVGLFTTYGGKIEAFLQDASTISFVITGPFSNIPGYTGPFNFADGAGNGRLNIGGSGVLLRPENVTMYTGADESYVADDSGPRIDSPFIENLSQVYDRGAWASLDLSGPRIELSFELGPGEGGLYSIGERVKYNHQIWRIMSVNAGAYTTRVVATPYTTVADKDAIWAGQTVAQYDAFWAGYRVYDSKVRPLWRTRP